MWAASAIHPHISVRVLRNFRQSHAPGLREPHHKRLQQGERRGILLLHGESLQWKVGARHGRRRRHFRRQRICRHRSDRRPHHSKS